MAEAWAAFAGIATGRLHGGFDSAGRNHENRNVLPESGPVAQLGARFHGMEEVTGSIPVRSTNTPSNNQQYARASVSAGFFCVYCPERVAPRWNAKTLIQAPVQTGA